MLFQTEESSCGVIPGNIYSTVALYFRHLDSILGAQEPTSQEYINNGYRNLALFLVQPELDFGHFKTPRPFDLNSQELKTLRGILILDCSGTILNLQNNSIDIFELEECLSNDLPLDFQELDIPKTIQEWIKYDPVNADTILRDFLQENEWMSVSDFLTVYHDISHLCPDSWVYIDNFLTFSKTNVENIMKPWSDHFLQDFFGIKKPEDLYIGPTMQKMFITIIDELFEIRKTIQTRLKETLSYNN